MSQYPNLFKLLEVGGVTVPNRIVRTAHSTGSPWIDTAPDLLGYHVARAKGGVGLTILEIAGVHRSSPTTIPVFSDRVIGEYARLAEAVGVHGMRVFQQLWHGGNAMPLNPVGGAPWSASDIPNPKIGLVPRPMTTAMIDEVVAAFGAAARRAEQGGLDGVEIHAGHGYLIGQFLSPVTNRREDDYGGSPSNRARFLRQILAAVRAEVSPAFAVGVRLAAGDEVEGGLLPDDVAELAAAIEADIDFLDVSLGSYYRFHKMLAPMDDPLGYELPTSEVVTRRVGVPTIVTGRIMTLDHASQIVNDGIADMVSMVRALIADPELVNKARSGRDREIRPCISSNQGCVGGLLTTGKMTCVVNVAAGRETTTPFEVPEPAQVRKRILIVGGGPAGLEAARTAALRGHDVLLYEMKGHLGGQVRIAATAPHRADIGAITVWLADEIERLGVKVLLHTAVDPDVVAEEAPDVVIIATGSTPRRDGFQAARPGSPLPGIDLPHVVTSWDVFGFGGRATIGQTALVYDDTGGYEAISVAEQLLAAGASVTFATRHDAIGTAVPAPDATVAPAQERLAHSPFQLVTRSSLVGITSTDVELVSVHGGIHRRVPAETVVLVGYNLPNRELADCLAESTVPVLVVGDANGDRTLQQAIHGAAAVARNL